MKYDYLALPNELPEKPTGWTEKMVCHLNFGGGRGSMISEVFDPNGTAMPFTHGYRPLGEKGRAVERGFLLPGVEPMMTWKELRKIWPIWIERARAKQRALTAK
jgi:hypothetical protein